MNARKISSLLLALVMLFTMIPTAAFAEGGLTIAHKFVETDTSFFTSGFNSMLDRNSDNNNSIYVFAMDSNENVKAIDSDSATVVNDNGSTDEHFITAQRLESGMLYVSASMKNTPVGSYTVKFTVDGTEYSYGISFSEQAGSGGNPGSGNAQLQFTDNALDESSWMTYAIGGPDIQVVDGENLFFRLMVNGSITPFTVVDGSGKLLCKSNGSDTTLYKVEPSGTGNGRIGFSVNYGSGSSYGTIFATVSGVEVAPDAASDYASAEVKKVSADSGSVSFGAVNASLGEHDEGFTISGDNLVFDTTGKAAGHYDAVVGGKLYTAVIFSAVNSSSVAAQAAPGIEATLLNSAKFNGSDGFNVLYFDSMNHQYFVRNSKDNNTQIMSTINSNGTYDGIYVFEKSGGSIVSVDSANAMKVVLGDDDTPFVINKVEIVSGVFVYRITPKAGASKATGSIGDTLIIQKDGKRAGEFSINFAAQQYGDPRGSYGITSDVAAANNEDTSKFVSNGLYLATDEDMSGKDIFYLVKQSGDPVFVDYLLYDEIKVGTLNVTSSNSSFVKVNDYVVKTTDGNNAIGVDLDINTAAEAEAELKITFQYADGTPTTWYYFVSVTGPVVHDGETVEVDTEKEFQDAYATMLRGTIILNPKQDGSPYKMNITHNSSSVGFEGAKGANIVIVGELDSANEPIITIDSSSIPAKWGNLTVDGNYHVADGGGKRVGIYSTKGNMLCDDSVTVRDCSIGFDRNPNGMPGRIDFYGTKFIACDIGVVANSINYHIQNCLFDSCGAAFSHEDVRFNEIERYPNVRNNVFKNNRVDIELNSSLPFSFAQNYFGHGGVGTAPVFDASVTNNSTFAPYYSDEARTTLKATLDGAAVSGSSVDIPVNLTLKSDGDRVLEGNTSTTLDTGIFAEIKGAADDLSASIPVTEAVMGEDGRMEAKVTTIWGFEKDTIDATQSKETMDLKVSDELSDTAKLIVSNNVESGAAQYVNFEHDGDLPGTATVKVLKTAKNSDTQNLKLYYINEQTGEVEEADIVDVAVETINGVEYYVVTVTHCSEYIISTGLTFKQEADEGEEDESITAPSGSAGSTDRTNPNTSVKSGVSLMPAAAIVVIAAAAYILNKKRA